jgi:hypothetical protein
MTYPPKNRVNTGLDEIQCELVTARERRKGDQNAMCIGARKWSLDPLPDEVSDISDYPAVIFRDGSDLELRLTPWEFRRLMARSLRPDEFFKLRDRYGMHFNWHDDFYNDDGEALQPK